MLSYPELLFSLSWFAGVGSSMAEAAPSEGSDGVAALIASGIFFLVFMAKERAAKQGVEAKTTCRTGKVSEEIKNAARECGASLVVLGRMEGDEGVFHTTDLDVFAAEIEVDTGVRTIIV